MKIKSSVKFFATLCMYMSCNSFALTMSDNENINYVQKTILADVNGYRIHNGLNPLKISESICEEATQHSRNMADNITPFGHDGFPKRMSRIFRRFDNHSCIAENVAFTYANAATVTQQWLESPGHRKNIEGHFNLTGISSAVDRNGRLYVTQIFLQAD